MNVLIVAATEFEITSDKIKNNANLVTGIGMINTAINLTKELIHKKFDLVINIGVAGSFSNKLKNGIVVEVLEDCFSEIGYEDGDFFSVYDKKRRNFMNQGNLFLTEGHGGTYPTYGFF